MLVDTKGIDSDNNVKYLFRDSNRIDPSPLESTIRDNASGNACRRITIFPKEFRFVSTVPFRFKHFTRIEQQMYRLTI